MRVRAADLLRPALHLLRHRLCLLRGRKENFVRDYDRSFEIRLSPSRNNRRGAAFAKKCPSLDERAGGCRKEGAVGNEWGTRYREGRSAGASHHGFENTGEW